MTGAIEAVAFAAAPAAAFVVAVQEALDRKHCVCLAVSQDTVAVKVRAVGSGHVCIEDQWSTHGQPFVGRQLQN